MRDRKVKLYFDIKDAIDRIEEFMRPIQIFPEYDVDLKTQSAIERQLGIIGEAIKIIKDIDPNEHIKYRDEIIGFRNILVHGYDTVSNAVVWSIIQDYLAPLKQEILDKLQDN